MMSGVGLRDMLLIPVLFYRKDSVSNRVQDIMMRCGYRGTASILTVELISGSMYIKVQRSRRCRT